jgi:spore germination protein KA
MGLAASFGFFGIIVGMIALVLHLCHLQSFGVPYMTPFAPFRAAEQKDGIVRVPWWQMYSHLGAQAANKRQQSSKGAGKRTPSEQKGQSMPEQNEGG